MNRQEVNIKGISTASTYTEGECVDVLNLRLKNGALQPVTQRKTVRTFTNEYCYLFEHRNADYVHTIGVRSGYAYLVTQNAGAPDSESYITSALCDSVSITQIGNVINILDANGMRSFLWSAGAYKEITIPELNIQLKRTLHTRSGETEWFLFAGATANLSEDERKNTAKSLFAKSESVLNAEGLLTDFHIGIAAIELFDGSYVSHSQPFLLAQSGDIYNRYTGLSVSDDNKDYATNQALFHTKDKNETNFGDNKIVKDGYISYAGNMKFYASNALNITDVLVLNTTVDFMPVLCHLEWLSSMTPRVWRTGDDLQFKLASTVSSEHEHIVKSISIFISAPVRMSDYEKIGVVKFGFPESSHVSVHENIIPEIKSNAEIQKELLNLENFYKVHEIPFSGIDGIANGSWNSIDLKGKLGESLYSRETLPVATVAATTKANGQYVYNSRLHLYDYSTEFNLPRDARTLAAEIGTGQFAANYLNIAKTKAYVQVKIKTDAGVTEVVNVTTDTPATTITSGGLAPILSYPDKRAYQMTVFLGDGESSTVAWQAWTVGLTPHPTHNMAMALTSDLKIRPINLGAPGLYLYNPPLSINRTISFPNGLKVSALNNPLYFPLAQNYSFNGKVLNLATNAQNVQDRNYGTHPLFVITETGWFTMTVDNSGAGVYTQVHPVVAADTPVNAKVIAQTPFGVLYIGAKGLMNITSQGAVLLTPQVEEERTVLNYALDETGTAEAPEVGKYFGGVLSLPGEAIVSFRSFIESTTGLFYDPTENEVIIVNSAYDYCYVFNIDAKMVYRSTEKPNIMLQSSLPQLQMLFGNNLVDYSDLQTEELSGVTAPKRTKVAFTTRGIAFGTRDIKKVERVVLRALLVKIANIVVSGVSKKPVLALYVSDDAVNYAVQRATNINTTPTNNATPPAVIPASYRDIDLGLMSRTKHRWYAVAFGATVSADTRIYSAEFTIQKEYNNDKQR